MAGPPPPLPSSVDSRSGFCAKTNTFHSLRPPITLPPPALPLSAVAYAFSLLPSPATPASSPPPPPTPSPTHSSSPTSAPSPLPYKRSSDSRRATSLSSSLPPASTYFALLSLGVVVSPGNPASTSAEVAYQCGLCNPDIAFAVASAASKTPVGVPTVILDSAYFTSLISGGGAAGEPVVVLSGKVGIVDRQKILQFDPAAILYSSGTTGRVKGVVLTHRNLIGRIATFTSVVTTVQLVTVPLFHVYGLIFSIKAIAMAETAVLQTERYEPQRMLQAVGRFRVTHLTLAPPALLAMLKVFREGGKYDLSSLEAVTIGGAPVGTELIRQFVSVFPNVQLNQGYGLTETAAGASRLIGGEESRHFGSVGRIAPGHEAKIVDPDSDDALLPGMRGEIWLRGPTIMKGYIGDQEATSLILTSEGWLKTGDLGYIDSDGFLFIIDRLKELIKYKGYQVPPAELENLLQTHPDIAEAAVIPYPHEEAGEVPMAFVVRHPHSALNEAQIMEFIAKQVAPYKRIHRVSFVNLIPKNAAGKILRKELVKLATSEISSKL